VFAFPVDSVTLKELEDSLPNGLHDAEVVRLSVDYIQRRLILDLSIWVGDMDDPPERREAYKNGQLVLSGLTFLIMEPPDPRYPYRVSPKLTVDVIDASKSVDAELLNSLPTGAFCGSFWVNQWNGCMSFAADDAAIVWMDDGAVTYRGDKQV